MRIIRFLYKYWYFAMLAPLMMIGEVLADLNLQVRMASIIDDGVLKGDIDLIYKTGLVMVGIMVIGLVTAVLCAVFTNNASHNFANDLRKKVFENIMAFSFEQVDDFSTGSLVTRLTNDVTQVQQMVSMSMRFVVRAVMLMVGGTVTLLSLDTNFFIVIAIGVPITLITIFFVLRKANPFFSIMQENLDGVNTVVEENVNGMRVVKAYVQEGYEFDRFQEANMKLCNISFKVNRTIAILNPVFSIVMYSMVIGVCLIGFPLVTNNTIGVGSITVGVNLISQILFAVMMFGNIIQFFSRAKASAKRLNAILDLEPTIKNGDKFESSNPGVIEFKNVSFTYPNCSDVVLDNINLKINKGETLGVLGSTGCGKTSLVNLITRFYDVTEGVVEVSGYNVKEYNLEALRSKVSTVLQKAELYSRTIKENITFGKTIEETELIKICKTAQSYDFIENTTDGFNTVVAEKGMSLSGGQKQRIAISRALVHCSEILILDDSTSALDLKTESLLLDALKKEYKEYTKIIVGQRISSVKDCDNIIVLDNGKIVSSGKHNELLENSEIYKDIYYSQINKGGAIDE